MSADRVKAWTLLRAHCIGSADRFECHVDAMMAYADEARKECIEICKRHYRALDAAEAIEKLSDKYPIQAHSKTEYKRLVTQGANVLPPKDRQ